MDLVYLSLNALPSSSFRSPGCTWHPRGEAPFQLALSVGESVRLPSDSCTVKQAGKAPSGLHYLQDQAQILRLSLRALPTRPQRPLHDHVPPRTPLTTLSGLAGLNTPILTHAHLLLEHPSLPSILERAAQLCGPGLGITSSGTPPLGPAGLACCFSVPCRRWADVSPRASRDYPLSVSLTRTHWDRALLSLCGQPTG